MKLSFLTLLAAFGLVCSSPAHASSDDITRGLLYYVNVDGTVTIYLGEANGDVEAAFQNAVKKCVAKGNSRASCQKRNNFDFTISPSLFTKE